MNTRFLKNIGETLLEHDSFGLQVYVSLIMDYAFVLAAILMVLLVGVKVATYFANPSKEMDPMILVKPILIIAALALYKPLVDLLLFTPTEVIEDVTLDVAIDVTGSKDDISFDRLFIKNMTFVDWSNRGEDEEVHLWDVNIVFEIIHFLIYLIAQLVGSYIIIRHIIVKGIYFVLGVFVLPFSLIPGNEEILKKWFFGFLSVLMWIPILRIFQTIMILMGLAESESTDVAVFSPLMRLALQICMIFFILQIPKYANMLVGGSGDSDSNGWLVFMGREVYYRKLGGMGAESQRRM